jgi:hypothetical protein
MSQNPPRLPPGKTNSVHIGHDRFAVVTNFAIKVSFQTGVQISPSQFVQHLVDHYGEFALAQWESKLNELSAQSAG